jgi:protein required for attachment to host cells
MDMDKSNRQWVVVANASRARILERAAPDGALVLLAALEHPESRLKGSDLEDDRPGREATDNSPGGNRFEPRVDARRKEHQVFARQIAGRLDDGRLRGDFDAVLLVASSPFLGELKHELSGAVRERLGSTIDSDWTSLEPRELEQRLRERHASA